MSEKPSVSDEEWAAFVESAREQGLGTEAQEKALRKARPPKRPKPAKAPRPPKRREPEGWRTGPAWQEMNGTARRRGRAKAALGITLVAALALVAVRPQLLTEHLPEGVTSALPSSWTDRPEDATPLAAETARPTAPPPTVDPQRPTLKEPFKGSPALRWGNGAAGIVPPEAKATGGLSKKRVAEGLRLTKALLVAANLDPDTLAGRRPAEALALIEPEQRDLHADMEASLRKMTAENDPLYWFTRFGPEVKPVGTVVKTRGRITFEAGDEPGMVLIKADYTFVYPLVKSRPGADEVARTVIRRTLHVGLYGGRTGPATPGTVTLIRHLHEVANSSCTVQDGFLHPQFREDAPDPAGVRPTGAPVDPYDRSHDQVVPEEAGCGRVSRT
ncbi:hypothetical protein [Streptomyces showdoensis]|uniref:Uncharacterized protein n=1 Tax=Streptomyces showdoensis TaxID=68268 RepID=A0A2P2GNI3_STREW|nr:hypothetical protein [Streptomyces showdoensis]KKZ73044.1 hypothetical protein VO63_14790 [Streptomyces showdoensis]